MEEPPHEEVEVDEVDPEEDVDEPLPDDVEVDEVEFDEEVDPEEDVEGPGPPIADDEHVVGVPFDRSERAPHPVSAATDEASQKRLSMSHQVE